MSKTTRVRSGANAQIPTKQGDRSFIPDNSITEAKLQDSSVGTAKLKDASVTPEKLHASTAVQFFHNYAQNAEFRFYQRQVPLTLTNRQDDQYGPDRWNILTSGGAVNVQTKRIDLDPVPALYRTKSAGQFRQADATPRQYGTVQILEGSHVRELRGKQVTFSLVAATDGTEVPSIRMAIVEWTGTEDVVTSDIVSSWAASPTLVANASYAAASGDLSLDSDFVEYSVTATLSSSFTNLILFVWTPNSEAQNDDFYITQIRLTEGSVAIPWGLVSKPPNQDLAECQRFYDKSYNLEVAPGTASATEGSYRWTNGQNAVSASFTAIFKVTMRAIPATFVVYSPATGTNNRFRNATAAADQNAAPVTATGGQGSYAADTDAAGAADSLYLVHWSADAEL